MSHAIVLVAVESDKHRKRIEAAVAHEMEPFDENGEWFKNGSRWDWYQIGGRYSGRLMGQSCVRKGDLNLEAFANWREAEARKIFASCLADDSVPKELRPLIFGIESDQTEDSYAQARRAVSFPAFLRARTWHENERMGWFGRKIKNECQLGRTEVLKGKCLVQDKKTGAKIVGWNDPQWAEKFWQRFIEPLNPETWLIVVDYHV